MSTTLKFDRPRAVRLHGGRAAPDGAPRFSFVATGLRALRPRAARLVAACALAGLALAPAPASAQLFGGNNNNQLSSMSVRLDSVENQMRTLNGQIEQLNHQISQLQQQIQRMQEDNEFRFQQLEGASQGGKKPVKKSDAGPAPGAAPTEFAAGTPADGSTSGTLDGGAQPPADVAAATPPPAAPAAAGGSGPLDLTALIRSSDASVPASIPPADGGMTLGESPVQSQTLGTLPADAAQPAATAPTASDATGTPSTAGTQVAALPDAAATPRGLYDASYAKFSRGDYSDAESGFRQFLSTYPNDKLEPDAQYWLGESLYARGRYRDAANAFLEGYTQHPDSRKGPESLFKLGMSLNGMGEKSAACASFAELLSKYPTASKSLQDRVRAEQKQASCS